MPICKGVSIGSSVFSSLAVLANRLNSVLYIAFWWAGQLSNVTLRWRNQDLIITGGFLPQTDWFTCDSSISAWLMVVTSGQTDTHRQTTLPRQQETASNHHRHFREALTITTIARTTVLGEITTRKGNVIKVKQFRSGSGTSMSPGCS